MYTAFFGLTRKPFNMTPDPAFLFLTEQHREALAGLTYAILDRKGFLALSGMAGAGKTTLLAWVLEKLPADKVQSSVILNPTLTRSEFLELAMLDFGIPDIPTSKAHRIWILQKFLLNAQSEGKTSVLIVDEAHKLSSEVLEEIRLLGNFECADEKLLQVVLIGQSELDRLLSRPELWQLKQRISVRLSLEPLGTNEVGGYIEHRWRVAGGKQAPPFSSEAVVNVAKWSKGIPRLINSICDNALVEAFADSTQSVSADHVRTAAGDLLLIEPPTALEPVPDSPPEIPLAPRIARPTNLATLDRYTPKAPPKQSVFARWAQRLKSG
jgi:general secretion pathway protein A